MQSAHLLLLIIINFTVRGIMDENVISSPKKANFSSAISVQYFRAFHVAESAKVVPATGNMQVIKVRRCAAVEPPV